MIGKLGFWIRTCGQGKGMGNADPQYKLQRRLLVSQYCERWQYKHKHRRKEVEWNVEQVTQLTYS
jgi:hypothetical protein